MILKEFGFVAFFVDVKASSFCIHLSIIIYNVCLYVYNIYIYIYIYIYIIILPHYGPLTEMSTRNIS